MVYTATAVLALVVLLLLVAIVWIALTVFRR